MKNGLLFTYIGLDLLFAAGGALILAVALMTQNSIKSKQTLQNVAVDLLLDSCPLKAGIINSLVIFVTFIASFPAILSPKKRILLKIHGYMVILSSIFTLILGLVIWFETLKTRANLNQIWSKQTPATQSLLQQKFQCCGYRNLTSPPFIQDSTCTNALVAANLQGCVGPFSLFANQFLDIIFTGDFGIVAIDALLLLAIACVSKHRKEQERFRIIDEKVGAIRL